MAKCHLTFLKGKVNYLVTFPIFMIIYYDYDFSLNIFLKENVL